MTVRSYTTVWCDSPPEVGKAAYADGAGCHFHIEGGRSTGAREARAEAKLAGWVHRKRQDICPACWPFMPENATPATGRQP